MMNGVRHGTNSEQKFREFPEKIKGVDWVSVRNMQPLDYEQCSNYTLTITATVESFYTAFQPNLGHNLIGIYGKAVLCHSK